MNSPIPSAPDLPVSSTGALIQRFPPHIRYVQYTLALEQHYLPQIRTLISRDLSEPYSIYVYRYFLYTWPELCFLAIDTSASVSASTDTSTSTSRSTSMTDAAPLAGVVICKLEPHRNGPLRGYIAMLATETAHRGRGIAKTLVSMAVDLMVARGADEIALETEETNAAAMRLYQGLGFVRSKRLHRYYLNGSGAFRLLLYCRLGVGRVPLDEAWDPYGLPPSAQPVDEQDGDGLLSRGIV